MAAALSTWKHALQSKFRSPIEIYGMSCLPHILLGENLALQFFADENLEEELASSPATVRQSLQILVFGKTEAEQRLRRWDKMKM